MDPPKGSPRLAIEAFPPKLLQVGAPEARQTPDPGRGWSLIIEPVTAANFALQILLLSRQASIHSGQRDHQQVQLYTLTQRQQCKLQELTDLGSNRACAKLDMLRITLDNKY